jgi:redox-sensitive bicupin YhaK (pirin superfamily)
MEIISYVLEGAARAQGQHGHRVDHRAGRRAAHVGGQRGHAHRGEPVAQRGGALPPDLDPARSRRLPPSYEQKNFSEEERHNRLRPVAARDGRDGALTVHQDVTLYAALLDAGQAVTHELAAGRHAWCRWRAAR